MKKFFVFAALALISVAATAQNYKFAHVNFSEVVQLMPEMDSARVQVEAASKETQTTYEAMIEEFQSKYSQYEQKQSTWTASIKQSKEQELGQIQTRIQEFEQSAQQELNALQNELMAPIYQKAQAAIEDLARRGGYIYVFDSSQFLYLDDKQSVDLTPAARTALGVPADMTLEKLQEQIAARQQLDE